MGRACAASSLVRGTGPGRQAALGAAAAAARSGPGGDSSYTQTVGPHVRQSCARRAGPAPGWLHGLAFHPWAASPATRRRGILAANAPFADVSVIPRRGPAISLTP